MNIKSTKQSNIGVLFLFLCVSLLIISSLIYIRYETAIADSNNRPDEYKNISNILAHRVNYMDYKNAPFCHDEIWYFNFNTGKTFLQTLEDNWEIFYKTHIPIHMNFYGSYISQLAKILNNNWILLIYCTGVIYFIVFIFLLYYIFAKIIGIDKYRTYFLLTLIGISPPVLALTATWLRDLLLIDLMLLFLISVAKDKRLLAILLVIMQLLLREYMLIPFFFIYLFAKNQNHTRLELLVKICICLFIIGVLYHVLSYIPGHTGINMGKIPFRILEATTGLCGSVVKGIAKLRGGLYDLKAHGFEVFSTYYYPIMYGFAYLYLFLKGLLRGKFSISKKSLSFFLLYFFTAAYLGILHGAQLGFLISRIKLIPFVLFTIFWGSCLAKRQQKLILLPKNNEPPI